MSWRTPEHRTPNEGARDLYVFNGTISGGVGLRKAFFALSSGVPRCIGSRGTSGAPAVISLKSKNRLQIRI